jgi:hypothetical protein
MWQQNFEIESLLYVSLIFSWFTRNRWFLPVLLKYSRFQYVFKVLFCYYLLERKNIWCCFNNMLNKKPELSISEIIGIYPLKWFWPEKAKLEPILKNLNWSLIYFQKNILVLDLNKKVLCYKYYKLLHIAHKLRIN